MTDENNCKSLENSKLMLNGFENRLRSYFSTDNSLTQGTVGGYIPQEYPNLTQRRPAQAHSGLDLCSSPSKNFDLDRHYAKPELTSPNLFTASRMKSELNQSLLRKASAERSKLSQVQPPISPSEEEVLKIVSNNKVWVKGADSNEISSLRAVCPVANYSLVTKQITAETQMYEKRLQEYRLIVSQQEKEMKELEEQLFQIKQESEYIDEYSVPKTLEKALLRVHYRGKLTKKIVRALDEEREARRKESQKRSKSNATLHLNQSLPESKAFTLNEKPANIYTPPSFRDQEQGDSHQIYAQYPDAQMVKLAEAVKSARSSLGNTDQRPQPQEDQLLRPMESRYELARKNSALTNKRNSHSRTGSGQGTANLIPKSTARTKGSRGEMAYLGKTPTQKTHAFANEDQFQWTTSVNGGEEKPKYVTSMVEPLTQTTHYQNIGLKTLPKRPSRPINKITLKEGGPRARSNSMPKPKIKNVLGYTRGRSVVTKKHKLPAKFTKTKKAGKSSSINRNFDPNKKRTGKIPMNPILNLIDTFQ